MGVIRHTIVAQVANQPGVLHRVAGLFARRGYNITSLAVGETEDPGISRMTIVVDADDVTLEQITKQLHKLIEVIKVSDVTQDEAVGRELALVKVAAGAAQRAEISQIVEIFRARIVDVSERTVIVELTGDEGKAEAMIQLLRPYGIKEIARTGKIAMVRSPKGKAVKE